MVWQKGHMLCYCKSYPSKAGIKGQLTRLSNTSTSWRCCIGREAGKHRTRVYQFRAFPSCSDRLSQDIDFGLKVAVTIFIWVRAALSSQRTETPVGFEFSGNFLSTGPVPRVPIHCWKIVCSSSSSKKGSRLEGQPCIAVKITGPSIFRHQFLHLHI